ncbi:hypothetical protein ACFQX4_10275 [Roseomonas sp. GCM10028921]
MPDRLSSLVTAICAKEGVGVPQGIAGSNDNFLQMEETGHILAFPPEPCWGGPGAILTLSMQDGRHGLGAVRAVSAVDGTGGTAEDLEVVLRLLAHYGLWLGFQGRAEAVRPGRLRRMLVAVGETGRIEYRLDLRRIARGGQRLSADATILLDGRPVALLDNLCIVFRPPHGGGTGRRRLGG